MCGDTWCGVWAHPVGVYIHVWARIYMCRVCMRVRGTFPWGHLCAAELCGGYWNTHNMSGEGWGGLYRPVGFLSRHVPHSWGGQWRRGCRSCACGWCVCVSVACARCTGCQVCAWPPVPHADRCQCPGQPPSSLSSAGEHRCLTRCQQAASSRVSRWLGSCPEPFPVALPTAVAPSRDTGARLSLSACFPACQASPVGSCCDFPDGCLAPSSSPSGWTSSWSTKLGQHISLAPALPFHLRGLAAGSLPGAGQLPARVIPGGWKSSRAAGGP